jgi:hypothetical protein
MKMAKNITAILLILITGGIWIYLDFLNKRELAEFEQTRLEFIQIHAQAKARFESLIYSDLSTCQVSAEKTKNTYLTRNQQPVAHSPGEFTTPQAIQDEAARMLGVANAACQQTFERSIRNGS